MGKFIKLTNLNDGEALYLAVDSITQVLDQTIASRVIGEPAKRYSVVNGNFVKEAAADIVAQVEAARG